MSARWIDYWENYAIPHDDRGNEYLGTEDFVTKGKFNFLGKSLKLSGKTKFNSKDGVVSSSSDYSLTHNISPISSYMITHKPNNVTFDGNFKLWSKENVLLTLYTNVKLDQNEKKRELPSKVHLRVHHDDNKIVGFGFENLDPFKSHTPDVLSGWALFGGHAPHGFKSFGGVYTGYQLSSKALLFQRYLWGLKHRHLTSYVEFSHDRVTKKIKNTEGVEIDTISHEKSVNVRVDGNVNRDLKVGGDVAYNIDTQKFETKVYGQYTIDKDTFVKAKLQNDNSLTVGLTHNYRGLINFGFVSRFELVSPKAVEGQTSSSLKNIKTKFGLLAELSETL